MKKIIVIDQSLSGGICHYSFALCNALASAGSEVSLVTSVGAYEMDGLKRSFEIVPLLRPEPRPSTLSQKIIRRITQKMRPVKWAEKIGCQVGQYLKEQKTQIAHQQWITDRETEPLFWASMRRQTEDQVPLVYTAHNVWPHDLSPGLKEQYRTLYTHPDRIVVHGQDLRRQMIEEAGVPEQKVRVIPHGNYHYLAEAVPAVPQEVARANLGLPEDSRVILFFGAIRPYKGLDVLLLAFERLLRRRTGVRYTLLIAGRLWGSENWEQSLYGGLCRSLKITEQVQVHQNYIPLSDFGLYFGAADAVCFPYRSASQSGALHLAYSYRKPVIATSVGSLPEVVQEGQTGLVVGSEEPDALADALEALLSDPEQCRSQGEYAHQWSLEKFSWEKIATETLQLYQEVGKI